MTDVVTKKAILDNDRTRYTKEQAQLVRAWGDWLSEMEWDHFATLTFSCPPTEEAAGKAFARWKRFLEERRQRRVDWFCAAELTEAGVLHLHALLRGTDGLTTTRMQQSWQPGRAKVDVYDPAKGAVFYVSKGIGCRGVYYDLSPSRGFSRTPL